MLIDTILLSSSGNNTNAYRHLFLTGLCFCKVCLCLFIFLHYSFRMKITCSHIMNKQWKIKNIQLMRSWKNPRQWQMNQKRYVVNLMDNQINDFSEFEFLELWIWVGKSWCNFANVRLLVSLLFMWDEWR